MGGRGLHFDHATHGVLDLMHVVAVPVRHEASALVEVTSGGHRRTTTQTLEVVRSCTMHGRLRGDGHDYERYNRSNHNVTSSTLE